MKLKIDPIDPDWPNEPHLDPDDSPRIRRAMERARRQMDVEEFARRLEDDKIRFSRKPEFIQMQEIGDYIPGVDDGEPPNDKPF